MPLNGFIVNYLEPLEPRQNYKDLYGVIGTRKGQYLIPKLQ